MHQPKTLASPQRQQGAATIFITIVLLLAVGLIALYANRGAIMEQRLAANEIRAKQAFAAANAGLDAALAQWRAVTPNIPTTNADRVALTPLQNGGGQASYYQAGLYDSDPAVAKPACPALRTTAMPLAPQPPALTQIIVVSCGWSDDNTSVQRVSQVIGPSESTGGTVQTPLIARGTANLLTGGATIMNYFNDLTIWSGGSVLGQSMTGKTFVRNIATNAIASENDPYRATGNSPACLNPPAGYECSTQGGTIGHDTVTGDTNLANKTHAQFFQYLFGKELTAYRDTDATKILSGNNTSSMVGMKNEVVWIEGNASFPNGSPVIGAARIPGNPGTPAAPVIIIVNGDLDLSGFNGEINGMIYVHGNVTGNGGPTIYGAMIVAGNANASGNLKIIFDPVGLTNTPNIGRAAKLPGTWRDW